MIIDEGRRFASAAFSVEMFDRNCKTVGNQLRNVFDLTFHVLDPRFATDMSCVEQPLTEEVKNTVTTWTISSQRVAIFLT